MRLTFLGATETVTGSKYLIEVAGLRILVDCGLFQGTKNLRLRNWSLLPIDAATLDAVILTHAHIDHSGYLPLLARAGYRGPVFATPGTADLCRILLHDSAKLQEEEADYANRHGFSKHHLALPLYTVEDAERALKLVVPHAFHTPRMLNEHVGFCLLPAGHILGAASLELHAAGKTIAFSGDLGRPHDPIMCAPEPLEKADYLVVESTYGDRLHEKTNPIAELETLFAKTFKRSGVVVIPSFAVGRAQFILHAIAMLKAAGRMANVPVFLDSPMAISATSLYRRHMREHCLTIAQIEALKYHGAAWLGMRSSLLPGIHRTRQSCACHPGLGRGFLRRDLRSWRRIERRYACWRHRAAAVHQELYDGSRRREYQTSKALQCLFSIQSMPSRRPSSTASRSLPNVLKCLNWCSKASFAPPCETRIVQTKPPLTGNVSTDTRQCAEAMLPDKVMMVACRRSELFDLEVVDDGMHARRSPRSAARGRPFGTRAHPAFQLHGPVLDFDLDMPRLALGVPLQRTTDLFGNIARRLVTFDVDEVRYACHAAHVADRSHRQMREMGTRYFAAQRNPALFHLHLDCIFAQVRGPAQHRAYGICDILVRAPVRVRQMHLHLDDNGLHARHALRSLFGGEFFRVTGRMTRQRYDTIVDRNADIGHLDRRIVAEFFLDFLLQLPVGLHFALLTGAGRLPSPYKQYCRDAPRRI